jgi:glycosyltransferase involved in cell wall biosynthesis
MRSVLHVRNSVTMGGVETSIVGWLQSPALRSFPAFLFCFEQASGSEKPFIQFLAARGLTAELLPWGKTKQLAGAVASLCGAIRAHWPCVVHTHDFRSEIVGWLAARRTGAPLVASNHAWHAMWPGIGYKQRVLEGIRGHLLRRFDRVIDVCETTRRESIRRGVPAHRVTTIYSGANPSKADNAVPCSQLRASLGLKQEDVVIGNLARMSPEKGQHYLLEAAARILPLRPRSRFLVVGEGPLHRKLVQQAEALGIESRVTFLTFQDDLHSAMSVLDIFVLPSLMEGMPIVLYNAMSIGVPVVATDVGGVGEVLSHEVTALLVQPGDLDGLCTMLIRLIDDAALREKLRRNAASLMRESGRFSAGNAIVAIERVYEEVLAGQLAGPEEIADAC